MVAQIFWIKRKYENENTADTEEGTKHRKLEEIGICHVSTLSNTIFAKQKIR